MVLDLRPEAFRTSSDDAVNVRRLDLATAGRLRQMRFVGSVWDRENDRISDSPTNPGRKLITFNNILKYGAFPLADIVAEMLRMGAERCTAPWRSSSPGIWTSPPANAA